MSKRLKALVLVLSFAIATFMFVGAYAVKAANNSDGPYRQLEVFTEVLSRIRTEYVEEPNIPAVTDGALHGLVESLDANSSYLTPAEYKEYKLHRTDGKGEIGATVSKRFGYAAVIAVVPGGPADKAGVDSGDIIEAIEGKSTREMSLAEVHNMLAGPPGSDITVSVVRPRRSEPLKLTITRDLVKMPPIDEHMLQEGIGYIKVDVFSKGKAQELAAKIRDAQQQGAKKLVLDLRDCADGDEEEGLVAANLFLNHGMIAYLEGQKFPRQTFNADPQKVVTNLPVVVLVNRGTAGPAEIVAAALLDNARADVLGDKTFGTGSVQKVIEIPDGSALILSVAKYYTPAGKAIQDTAITPNILVADNSDDFALPDDDENNSAQPEQKKEKKDLRNDEQLKRAIEVLKNRDKKAA